MHRASSPTQGPRDCIGDTVLTNGNTIRWVRAKQVQCMFRGAHSRGTFEGDKRGNVIAGNWSTSLDLVHSKVPRRHRANEQADSLAVVVTRAQCAITRGMNMRFVRTTNPRVTSNHTRHTIVMLALSNRYVIFKCKHQTVAWKCKTGGNTDTRHCSLGNGLYSFTWEDNQAWQLQLSSPESKQQVAGHHHHRHTRTKSVTW